MVAFRHPKGLIDCLTFSPDGNLLATGGERSNGVRIWDMETGSLRAAYAGHTDEVRAITFSRDGRFVVTGSRDGTVRVLSSQDGSEVHVLRDHTARVTTVAISPDGVCMASGSWDGTIRVWDIEQGLCQGVFRGHQSKVSKVTFTPDGRYLVSASEDDTVRIWKAGSKGVTAKLRGHEKPVTTVAFVPDSDVLVSVDQAGKLGLWDAENGSLLALTDRDSWDENDDPRSRKPSLDVVEKAIEEQKVLLAKQRYAAQRRAHVPEPADKHSRHAYLVVRRESCTAIKDVRTGREVAWFATPLYGIASHPDKPKWAGYRRGHVWLITLEGRGA
jgi:WD40 repeat protein